MTPLDLQPTPPVILTNTPDPTHEPADLVGLGFVRDVLINLVVNSLDALTQTLRRAIQAMYHRASITRDLSPTIPELILTLAEPLNDPAPFSTKRRANIIWRALTHNQRSLTYARCFDPMATSRISLDRHSSLSIRSSSIPSFTRRGGCGWTETTLTM